MKRRGSILRPRVWPFLLLLPALIFLCAIYAYPVGRIFWLSVSDPDLGLDQYRRFFTVPVYVRVLGFTVEVALLVTATSLILGYPVAYLLASVSRTVRSLLLIFVLLPFWTSLLVRTYAWMALLQKQGLVNRVLIGSGVIKEPLALVYNTTGAVIGMTHILLPFMILSLFSVMVRIDRRLVSVARTMGAGSAAAFWWIFLPLSLPGVAAGCLLVFIASLGFFVTPALLGGPRDLMAAQLIETEINTSLDWGFASAIAVVLFVVTILLYAIYQRFLGLGRLMTTDGA